MKLYAVHSIEHDAPLYSQASLPFNVKKALNRPATFILGGILAVSALAYNMHKNDRSLYSENNQTASGLVSTWKQKNFTKLKEDESGVADYIAAEKRDLSWFVTENEIKNLEAKFKRAEAEIYNLALQENESKSDKR